MSRPRWVCPCSWRVCFPSLHCSGSRLLYQELSEVGPGLHALPRSKPLRFRFSGTPQRCRLGRACVLCSFQVRAAQVTRCLVSVVVPSWRLWLIASLIPAAGFPGWQWARPLRCAVCVFWGADLWLQPSRQMSTIQNPKKSWLATNPACSLVKDASLGPRLPASSSDCPCLPVSGPDWPVGSWLALLSPLFCERAWQCLRLGLFAG